MLCPYCGSDAEYDEVDIGVGMQQCGPLGCPYCHAIQFEHNEDTTTATEEEIRLGWWKGDTPCRP